MFEGNCFLFEKAAEPVSLTGNIGWISGQGNCSVEDLPYLNNTTLVNNEATAITTAPTNAPRTSPVVTGMKLRQHNCI